MLKALISWGLMMMALLLGSLESVSAQVQTDFGKNRVQYHDFTWLDYQSPHFTTYWNLKDQNLGVFAVQCAERDYRDIQSVMEYRINEKIEMLVYSDLTDLKMSNIGVSEVFNTQAGVTTIVANKIFIHFDGNHHNLRRQIREGVARVLLNNMIFGANIQEMVQNAVLLHLPPWFTEGIVSFTAEKWSTDLDNQLSNAVRHNLFSSFNEFASLQPRLAGHAFWHYIDEKYGSTTISNLLYITRINRSVESGFLYVLGTPLRIVIEDWMNDLAYQYGEKAEEQPLRGEVSVPLKNKPQLTYTQQSLSPNGRAVAYVTNELGLAKVSTYDINKKQKTTIFRTGRKNNVEDPDFNYPLISWNKSGTVLAIVYEKKDQIYLLRHNYADGKQEITPIFDIERIESMDWLDNKTLVFSGIFGGYSDIFYYPIGYTVKRLTTDYYDDLQVTCFMLGDKPVISWASNRGEQLRAELVKMDSILPLNPFDIYMMSIGDTAAVRVTDTPYANERSPKAYDDNRLAFLSDNNGVYNRYLAQFDTIVVGMQRLLILDNSDSLFLHPDSAYAKYLPQLDTTMIIPVLGVKAEIIQHSSNAQSPVGHSFAAKTQKAAELYQEGNRYRLRIKPMQDTVIAQPTYTRYREMSELKRRNKQRLDSLLISPSLDTLVDGFIEPLVEEKDVIPTLTAPVLSDTSSINIDNYFFQTDFEQPEEPEKNPVAAIIVEERDGNIKLHKPSTPEWQKPGKAYRFNKRGVQFYDVRFKTNAITTTLDNSLLFGGIGANLIPGGTFNFPRPGILLKTTIEDVFEDYRFELGMRVPLTFNGAEYFIVFENLKKRLDQRYGLYRQTRLETYDYNFDNNPATVFPVSARSITHLGMARLKYPFDVFRSIRATGFVRLDKTVFLSEEPVSLSLDDLNEQRIGVSLEYVFDNTYPALLNIIHGTRYKFYAEAYKSFAFQLANPFRLDFNAGFMGVVGADVRHYVPVGRKAVLALRGTAASSFGSERLLYFLGGVENWWLLNSNNAFDLNVTIPSENVAYSVLASPMRGFKNNIRNGFSFALLNVELRLPVFSMLFQQPIRSAFLRNFQLVAFTDIGSAWQTTTPFSEDNPLNTITISNPQSPVPTVVVNYFRNPIVMGIGGGVRTTLFGYFIKADYAWGLETNRLQKPLLYLSLGTDF